MRDMQPPSMGVNGFGRRSHNFSSPSLVDYRTQHHHFGSQPSIVQNGGSQSPPDYALLFDQPVVVLRAKKPSTVRSAKEESRLRSQQPPSNIQRVQAIRSRPQSTASYNSLASSGMENIQWRNSVMSSVTPDNRRHTFYDEEDNPRVVRRTVHSTKCFIRSRGHIILSADLSFHLTKVEIECIFGFNIIKVVSGAVLETASAVVLINVSFKRTAQQWSQLGLFPMKGQLEEV